MKHYYPPLSDDLPKLPIGCDEIQATAKPQSDDELSGHLDRFPGLDHERLDRLSEMAVRAQGGGYGQTTTGATVLGISDLLRTTSGGTRSLHPRVMHVLPLGCLDPLLEAVTEHLELDSSMNSYQYPAYLLECRGSAPDQMTLYPPEYHIAVTDIARDLRANDLLTSVRRPDQSFPNTEMIDTAIEAMGSEGSTVDGFVTILQPDDALEPKIFIYRYSNRDDPPSKEQVEDLRLPLLHRHGILLDVHDHQEWSQ